MKHVSILSLAVCATLSWGSNSKIIWTDAGNIVSAGLNGEEQTVLTTMTPFAPNLATHPTEKAVLAQNPQTKMVSLINLDTSIPAEDFVQLPGNATEISYDTESNSLYFINSMEKCISKTSLTSGKTENIAETVYDVSGFISDFTFVTAQNTLYWSDSYSVFRLNNDDDTGVETLFQTEYGVSSIAVDAESNALFIAHNPFNEIIRISLENGYSESIVPVDTLVPDYIADIAYDNSSESIYWIATTSIKRRSMGATINETLVADLATDYSRELSLSIDVPEVELTEAENCFAFTSDTLWSVTNAAYSGSSDLSADENGSLEIKGSGTIRLKSVKLNTTELSEETGALGVSLYLSDINNQWWSGSVSLIAKCPSAGIWHSNLGTVNLTGVPVQEWNRLNFSVPNNLLSALEGEQDDLEFEIILELPASDVSYFFDSIEFIK